MLSRFEMSEAMTAENNSMANTLRMQGFAGYSRSHGRGLLANLVAPQFKRTGEIWIRC
jgi:hypothetical protein